MAQEPAYIDVPSAARAIPPPPDADPTAASGIRRGSQPAAGTPRPSFPPPPTPVAPKRVFPGGSSLSTNVSDLVLSSLLPANLPKLPANAAAAAPGRARELTSQREGLGLNVMSNNFRRFVTKVGPVFWLQDRVEEVLFWQKPIWTWAYMLAWTFICFQPRTLLFLPSAVVLAILIQMRETKNPLPSLFGVMIPAPNAGSQRIAAETASYTASTAPEAEGAPVVPAKEAESAVDYYMNIQAIQNLMGMIADIFDLVTPYLALLGGKDTSPTSFPLTPTHLVLALLPPTLLLPLTPSWAIPYLLLPAGLAPPLFFHPHLTAFFASLPRSRAALTARSKLEDIALTDGLPDSVGLRRIARIAAWENERLDPQIVAKPPPGGLQPGAYAARFLRAAERGPWTKVRNGVKSLWADEDDSKAKDGDDRMVLALKDGWAFVPGEDWKVDVCSMWSDVGTDADGWAYTDDAWSHPSPLPQDEPSAPGSPPGPRRVTRRRQWWRRVYLEAEPLSAVA